MYKLYSYWSAPRPEDVEAFEGSEPLHYRIAELAWDDRAAFEECAASPEWTTLRECSGTMIDRFGVSLTVEAGEEVVAELPGS